MASTVWRLLVRVDAEALSRVLAGWLRARLTPPTVADRRWRRVIAIDGKVLRGSRRPDGTQIHLLSAYDTGTGLVLAQVPIAAESNEIPAFTPLLDRVQAQLGSLHGVLIVAVALHAQTGHAREAATRGAHLMVTVKANQPTLYTLLKALPWNEIPVGDQRRDKCHGRKETLTVRAMTDRTPGGLPVCATGGTHHPNSYGQRANQPRDRVLDRLAGRRTPSPISSRTGPGWSGTSRNRLHWIRDVTFREDAHQARTGNGPAVAAVLRNTAIGYH